MSLADRGLYAEACSCGQPLAYAEEPYAGDVRHPCLRVWCSRCGKDVVVPLGGVSPSMARLLGTLSMRRHRRGDGRVRRLGEEHQRSRTPLDD